MEPWERLLRHALACLDQAAITPDQWRFGGGTVLMLSYAHRQSRDVDIFFPDRQLLGYVSPRVNDALDAVVGDYAEQANFTRLVLEEGKIDFIHAAPATSLPPVEAHLAGRRVLLDSPAEIIAKKVVHRGEEFKPRDVFDLAVAQDRDREDLLACRDVLLPHAEAVRVRIRALQAGGLLRSGLDLLEILPAGAPYVAPCAELALGFLDALRP